MRNTRWYLLKVGFLLFIPLLITRISSAEIYLTVIGEDKEISHDFAERLKQYLPQSNYVYYNYKNPKVQNLLKELHLAYFPIVIYDKDKLDSADKDFLKKKRLLIQKDQYSIFPSSRLQYITDVHLLNRRHISNQLSLFVMSMCPYGERAEWKIIKFIKENNLPVKIKLYFIADIEDGQINSMHGADEVEEDIHQLLMEKYWPNKLYDYLLSTENTSHFEALKKAGISYGKIGKLRKEGESLLRENLKTAQHLDIHASPTFLWENEYLISGLDSVVKILEEVKAEKYKKTHPVAEYKIIGLGDYKSSGDIFSLLEEYFRLKGNFIPFMSSLAEKFINKFKINYLPFISIKKGDNASVDSILKNKLGWEEKGDKFIMSKERVLEVSPIYYLTRKKESNQVDIIAGKKELNKFINSSFVKILFDSGIKVNFHKQGIFFNSELYKNLGVKSTPLILWQNQYLVSNFRQLLGLAEVKQTFENLKTDRKIILDFFSSPSCHFCKMVEDKVLPQMMEKYGNLLDIVKFDTSQPLKYEFLLRMEKYFDINEAGIPKIFLGKKVLIGKNEIEQNLEMGILNVLFSGAQIFNNPFEHVKIDYFYNPLYIQRNKEAEYIYNEFLQGIEKRYQGKITIIRHNITKKENFDLMLQQTKQVLGKENYFTPKIFIAGNLLEGADGIKQNMDLFIQEKLLPFSKEQKESVLFSKISKFTLPAVVSAGLLDGINPCAFTVIIFFISFLAMAGYKKKEMFYVGSSFIFAVFLTYLLIGLGLFTAFYRLAFYKTISGIFRYIIIGIVFLLAGLNLYDYLVYKIKKTPKNLILQLPGRIKFLIKKIIGKGYREQDRQQGIVRLIAIALGVGFIVSILESVCTGQMYFPTVAFLAQLPGIIKVKAAAYLVLYNLMFIVPLIIIFLLGLIGVTSEQFAVFIKRHLGKIKLLSALLFIFLGYILVIL